MISIVFSYESENNIIYSMWAMFYQWIKIPKKIKNFCFYIIIWHLVLVTFICFIHINT
jgi:hypothetical protein